MSSKLLTLVTTHVLNQISPEAMANEDQWPMSCLLGPRDETYQPVHKFPDGGYDS